MMRCWLKNQQTGFHIGIVEGVFAYVNLFAGQQLRGAGETRWLIEAGQIKIDFSIFVAALLSHGYIVVVLRNHTQLPSVKIFGEAVDEGGFPRGTASNDTNYVGSFQWAH